MPARSLALSLSTALSTALSTSLDLSHSLTRTHSPTIRQLFDSVHRAHAMKYAPNPVRVANESSASQALRQRTFRHSPQPEFVYLVGLPCCLPIAYTLASHTVCVVMTGP